MHRGNGHLRNFRIVCIACAACLFCCGGGGGGVDVTPPTTNLDFVLGPTRGPTPPLTVTSGGSSFTLASNPPVQEMPLIRGTWDTETLNATVTGDPDNVILWADTTGPAGQPLFGSLSVVASRTVRWNGGDDPTAGEYTVTSRDAAFPGRVRARVSLQGATAGVTAEYDAGGDGIYEESAFTPWAGFGDLWADGAAPLYQRVSSYVFFTRDVLFSAMDFSIQATLFVEDLRGALLAAGSDNAVAVSGVCAPLSGVAGQPGTFTLAWTDVNGNGQIDYDLSGAGLWDTFTFTISQCWIDDPADPEDFLLDGALRFAYYERNLQWSPVFDNLVVTRTLNGAVVPDATATYNGGFSVFMTIPAGPP
ncbi:MAG: hypothetical protein AB1346_13725 [Thermodesulfobacteriota bacterium]